MKKCEIIIPNESNKKVLDIAFANSSSLKWNKKYELIDFDDNKIQYQIEFVLIGWNSEVTYKGYNFLYHLCRMIEEKCIIDALEICRELENFPEQIVEKENHSLKSIVRNRLEYEWFEKKDHITIIDMAVDIIYYFAIGHILRNGNKRTAILIAGTFLERCGFHLKDSFNKSEFLIRWEEWMITIVEKHIKREKPSKIKEFISNEIKQKIIISNEYV